MKVKAVDESVNVVDEFPTHVFVDLEAVWRRTQTDMPRHFRAVGGSALARGSHAKLLDILDAGGTRPAEVAARAGVTKQAVGVRLRELEELGLVRFDADPADGRAVLVRRTRSGEAARRAARRAIAAMEQEWAEHVGAERYAVFREVLSEIAEPALSEWAQGGRR